MSEYQKQIQINGRWPEKELERVDTCPICEGQNKRILYSELSDRVFFCSPGTWTLYKCNECGSAYLNPRPTAKSIGLAYQQYYTHAVTAESKDIPNTPLADLRLGLHNGYVNKRYGYKLTPEIQFGYYLAQILPLRRLLADRMIRNLSFTESNTNLLDIGCGNGTFMLQMKESGWIVEGVEPDPLAASLANQANLVVHQGNLNEIILPDDHYDAITMNHVIEHLRDPQETLKKCYSILRPGGILWIATPNLNSVGHSLFGSNWRGLEPPRHLIIFTPNSLQTIIKHTGFINIANPASPGLTEQMFRASWAITNGSDPNADSNVLTTRLRWEASITRIQNWLHPESSEELILYAQKPK